MSIYLGPHMECMTDGYSVVVNEINNRTSGLGIIGTNDLPELKDSSMSVGFDNSGNMIFFKDREMDYGDIKIYIHLGIPRHRASALAKYSVSFMFWESTIVPPYIVDDINSFDEFWTCSNWAKEIFIKNGVVIPIYVFDLGFDPSIFKIKNNFDRGDSPFTYLHVGSEHIRKNTQLLINAFLKLHDGDMNYRLILKSNGSPFARVSNDSGFGCYDHPQIQVIDYTLECEDMAALYHSADCFIYPTTGEGWGLSPFTAIACGIPTICTNVSACQEYAHLSVPLAYELVQTHYGEGFDHGKIGWPSLDDLCERMLYVENNHKEVIDKTYEGAVYLQENYSWDKTIGKIVDRIKLLKGLYDN
jgi:glycosyltransferase involved in cell wall biosynthesis